MSIKEVGTDLVVIQLFSDVYYKYSFNDTREKIGTLKGKSLELYENEKYILLKT